MNDTASLDNNAKEQKNINVEQRQERQMQQELNNIEQMKMSNESILSGPPPDRKKPKEQPKQEEVKPDTVPSEMPKQEMKQPEPPVQELPKEDKRIEISQPDSVKTQTTPATPPVEQPKTETPVAAPPAEQPKTESAPVTPPTDSLKITAPTPEPLKQDTISPK